MSEQENSQVSNQKMTIDPEITAPEAPAPETPASETMAPELLRRIVEGALLAAAEPLSEDRLLSLIDEGERPEKAELKAVLEQIAESCGERGFELKQVASGWRFQVPEDLAPWVNRLWEEKPQKYSRATLETLAIIAYRQPITRGDIEEIRGVAVSSNIVRSLSERGWIRVVGQRDVPGKPSLYATTREFLDYFNLRTLDDLPTLAEIRDIDSLNQALDLDQHVVPDEDDDVEDGAETAEPAKAEASAQVPGDDEQAEMAVEAELEADAEAGSTGEAETEKTQETLEEVAPPLEAEAEAEPAIAEEAEQENDLEQNEQPEEAREEAENTTP